jgi:hypothetical protein
MKHLRRIFESNIEDDLIDNFVELEDFDLAESPIILKLKDTGDWWKVTKDLLDKKNIQFEVDMYDNCFDIDDERIQNIMKLSNDVIGIGIVYKFPSELTFFNSSNYVKDIDYRKDITKKIVNRIEKTTEYKSLLDPSEWFYSVLGSPRFYFTDRSGMFFCSEIYFYK